MSFGRAPQFRGKPRSFGGNAKPAANPTVKKTVEASEELPHLEFVIGAVAGLGVGYELTPIAISKIKSLFTTPTSLAADPKLLTNPYSRDLRNVQTSSAEKDQCRENYFAWSRVEREERRHRESCIVNGFISLMIGATLCVSSSRGFVKSTAKISSLENRFFFASGLSVGSYGMAKNWGALLKRSDNFAIATNEANYWCSYFNQPVEKVDVPTATSEPVTAA